VTEKFNYTGELRSQPGAGVMKYSGRGIRKMKGERSEDGGKGRRNGECRMKTEIAIISRPDLSLDLTGNGSFSLSSSLPLSCSRDIIYNTGMHVTIMT